MEESHGSCAQQCQHLRFGAQDLLLSETRGSDGRNAKELGQRACVPTAGEARQVESARTI